MVVFQSPTKRGLGWKRHEAAIARVLGAQGFNPLLSGAWVGSSSEMIALSTALDCFNPLLSGAWVGSYFNQELAEALRHKFQSPTKRGLGWKEDRPMGFLFNADDSFNPLLSGAWVGSRTLRRSAGNWPTGFQSPTKRGLGWKCKHPASNRQDVFEFQSPTKRGLGWKALQRSAPEPSRSRFQSPTKRGLGWKGPVAPLWRAAGSG